MLRAQIEAKYGPNWWSRRYKMDVDHVVKLCVRGIDEKIPLILKHGAIYQHPEKPRRYVCVHRGSETEYTTLIFVPGNNSNFIVTGFPSKPEEIEMWRKIRSEVKYG
ncbi:MAG: hypothetical protein FJY76_03765 [Candidatus Aenigmarchaeota archaeon]|nr:hypothetical protein [Candidatus Aenigmarchaeota archaeon]